MDKILPLSDEESAFMLMFVTVKRIKKYNYFVQEGEFCNYIAFINSGLTKTCYRIHDVEYISEFNVPGDWVSVYESFLTRKQANFSVQALEDTELLLISYDGLRKLYEYDQKFERFGRLLAENRCVFHIQARLYLMKTPKEKYMQLLEEMPALFDMVPLKEIAYFIGVTPESLSRIRRRLSTVS